MGKEHREINDKKIDNRELRIDARLFLPREDPPTGGIDFKDFIDF
jgi:hypothetical protein